MIVCWPAVMPPPVRFWNPGSRKSPVPRRSNDFGAMSYADAKVGPQIEKRARAKLGGEGDNPDPVRLALSRAQAARRIVGTELAVACAERESDHVLVLSTKKRLLAPHRPRH